MKWCLMKCVVTLCIAIMLFMIEKNNVVTGDDDFKRVIDVSSFLGRWKGVRQNNATEDMHSYVSKVKCTSLVQVLTTRISISCQEEI